MSKITHQAAFKIGVDGARAGLRSWDSRGAKIEAERELGRPLTEEEVTDLLHSGEAGYEHGRLRFPSLGVAGGFVPYEDEDQPLEELAFTEEDWK